MNQNISKKQRMNITIDMDIYFAIKQSEINVSQVINDFLKLYFAKEEHTTQEIQELQYELDASQHQLKELQKHITEIAGTLSMLKAKEEEENKADYDRLMKIQKGLRASNWLNAEDSEFKPATTQETEEEE